jgi:Na+/H+ antiporter NhaA
MSLFIGSLAFGQGATTYAQSNTLGILLGSLLSAVAGMLLLMRVLPRSSDPT